LIHFTAFIAFATSPSLVMTYYCVSRAERGKDEKMFAELVMVIGSLGIAFSIYGKYRYRHYESNLRPSVAARMKPGDGASRLRLVSARGHKVL
jgi:hypothetical protein